MIRILHVVYKMDRGGTETMIMNLYRHIDKSKVQFDFVETSSGNALFDEEILSLGGRIFHCKQYKPWNHFKYTNWWKTFFREHAKEYIAVHGHLGSTAAIYLNIAKKFGLHTIAHSHSTYANITLGTLVYMFYSYWTRYIADSFFACSRAAGISRYGTKKGGVNSCYVLNNGIELEKYSYSPDIRKSIRIKFDIENKLVLGHVGRFVPVKNHQFILEILKELKKNNIKIYLLLIGDGELKDNINLKIKELGLTSCVKLLGDRSDVNELLQAIDVLVFPSLYEGLPLSLIEAQTSGLPIIASTNVPQEVNVTGLCSFKELGNIKDWTDIILSQDISHRQSYEEECRKAGYDIKQTANWLEEFYLNLTIK